MFERRIRILLAGIAGLYAVFLARVFFLQTFEAHDSRVAVAESRKRSFLVPPGRGTLRDADGTLLAWDDLGFHLEAVPRDLGAREWECGQCGRISVTFEGDPGAEDLSPLAAGRPVECRCGASGEEARPSEHLDRLGLAHFLGEDRESLRRLLDNVHARGWDVALAKAGPTQRRTRRHVLRDWTSRPRPVRRNVSREVAMEVYLNPQRYRGLRVTAERVRRHPEDLPDTLTAILGRTGPALAEDRERLLQQGIGDARIYRMVLGRSGLERSFDGRLRGSFGEEKVSRDLYGRVKGEEVLTPVHDGADIRLTLSMEL
ncbi:MAG: penicillin-binding protein 2 [Planctomycetota bacterium]